MKRFELNTLTRMRVKNVNPRREKNGTENKPAVDVKLQVDLPNSALDMFDPGLMSALYCKIDGGQTGETQAIPGTEVTQLPNLRFPKAGPIKWDLEGVGYTVTIDQGLGGKKSDLVLVECKVGQFVLTPKEGGTVVVSFRAQSNHIDDKQFGRLCMMIDNDISATAVGPKAEQDEVDPPDPDSAKAAPTKTTPKGTKTKAGDDGKGENWPFPKGGKKPDANEQTPEGALAGAVAGEAKGVH